MATLTFEDLQFEPSEDSLTVRFWEYFYFDLPSEVVSKIAPFTAQNHEITFDGVPEERARSQFNTLLDQGFLELASSVTKKPTTYVHRGSGIPLIGNVAFGITDRNSTMLEIKPVTGCNMNCIFCSVDEGLVTKKTAELVIEPTYLAEETDKVIAHKNCDVQITLNAHGEPTLYRPMPQLIRLLRRNPHVTKISLITNGTLLTKEFIDEVVDAGLTRFNFSLNAISDKMAKILEGHGKYSVEHVKEMARYAASKCEVFLSPVYVAGYNDEEISLIIEFAKEIGAKVGIQNFLNYPKGRQARNSRETPWPVFFEMLKKLEEKHNFKLILDASDFDVSPTQPLPKPFRKGQVVAATIRAPSRYPGEYIAATDTRSITVVSKIPLKMQQQVKLKITSDKHNIFFGQVVK